MKTLPQIPRWQIIIHALKNRNVPLSRISNYLYRNEGTMKLHIGGIHPMILTSDPNFIQHILQKNPRKYGKCNRQFDNIKQFWGQGLLTNDGPSWLRQRRLIQPGFHKNRLREVMKLMDQVTDEFLNGLDESIRRQPTIDMHSQMKELTCRIIAHTIFSSHLEEEEFRKFNNHFSRIQSFILKINRQPFFRWWHKISGQNEDHKQLSREINAIFQKHIQERKGRNEASDDLLQMLLDIRYEDTGEGMTNTQLLDEINILFIGGHETSANVLSWAWYLLSKHPTVLEKVIQEVSHVFPDGQITFDGLMQLGYTQQVLEETMRLFPPIWVTTRVATEDDEFNGIAIKKGTNIGTFFYGLHRSPNIWEKPDSFVPERFTKLKKKARHPFAYVPFAGGPRLCIGKQFAMIEMKLVLAKMVKRYHLSLEPNQKVAPVALVNLQPKGGIKMNITQRKIHRPVDYSHRQTSVETSPLECPFLAKLSAAAH